MSILTSLSIEQQEYLSDNWGDKELPFFADKFNISEDSVILIAKELNLGCPYDSTSYLTVTQIAKLISKSNKTIINLIKTKQLKGSKIRLLKDTKLMVHTKHLMTWLKNNQDQWNSKCLPLYALGEEPNWLKLKRTTDFNLPKKDKLCWTKEDYSKLKMYYKNGYTSEQIAKLLGRTESAIKYQIRKVFYLEESNKTNVYIYWTKEEKQIVANSNLTDEQIALNIGRTREQVSDLRRRLKEKGLYKGSKNQNKIKVRHKNIKELLNKGYTFSQILNKIDVTSTTLCRDLRQIKKGEKTIEN